MPFNHINRIHLWPFEIIFHLYIMMRVRVCIDRLWHFILAKSSSTFKYEMCRNKLCTLFPIGFWLEWINWNYMSLDLFPFNCLKRVAIGSPSWFVAILSQKSNGPYGLQSRTNVLMHKLYFHSHYCFKLNIINEQLINRTISDSLLQNKYLCMSVCVYAVRL